MGCSPLSPHRRWALDTLVEAIQKGNYGVTDVIDKRDGKIRHMIGKVAKDDGVMVSFIPLAVVMDQKILEDYTHDTERSVILTTTRN